MGSRSCVRDRQPGGNIGVGRDDHFIARPDAICAQDQVQGLETVAHADAMLYAAIGSEFAFKCFNFLAENIPAGFHDTPVGGIQLCAAAR